SVASAALVRLSEPRSRSPGLSTPVPSSTATAMGMLMNSNQRQLRYSVSAPPSSRPTTDARPAIAPYTPSALVRAGPAGSVVPGNDSPPGAARAAPQP